MNRRSPFAAALCALLAGCAATSTRVPVMEPAALNLLQFECVAVDRCLGEGSRPFATEFIEALREVEDPLTGARGIRVLRPGDGDAFAEAPIVLRASVMRHGVADEVVEERTLDLQGLERIRRKRQLTACVSIHIEATDQSGLHVLDAADLNASACIQRYCDEGPNPDIDPAPLLASARQRAITRYLQRVLPRPQLLEIELYSAAAVPELRAGNECARQGQWEQARRLFQQALLDLPPERAEHRAQLLFNLGVALQFTDRFAAARATLEQARTLSDDARIVTELQRNENREQTVLRLRSEGLPARPY